MSKQKKITSSFLIGLFVIVGTIVIAAAVIWLGAEQFMQKYQYYNTYFDVSVDGLEVGSTVKYLGVPVGSVSKIRIAKEQKKLVEVVVQINQDVEIKDIMRFRVDYAGITGSKLLTLYYPSNSSTLMAHPKLNFDPKHPVIPSTPSGLEEIATAAQDMVNKLKDINYANVADTSVVMMAGINDLVREEELYKTIKELSRSMVLIRSILEKIDTTKIVQNVDYTSKELYETSKKLDAFADELILQMEGMDLDNRVEKAFNTYDTTMTAARNTIDIVGYRTETLLFNMTEALEELRLTNKQIRRSLRELTADPARSLLSEPPPPEK